MIPNKVVLHCAATPDSSESRFSIDDIRRWHMEDNGWCFSLDTEILTANGWKDYASFNKEQDRVFSITQDKFINVKEVLYFKNKQAYLFNNLNSSFCYTENHKVLAKTQNQKNYKVQELKIILSNIKTPYKFIGSVVHDNVNESEFPASFYKLCSFIVADGWIEKTNNKIKCFRISVKKQRKVEYLKSIFSNYSSGWSFHYGKTRDCYHFFISKKFIYFNDLLKLIYAEGRKELNWNFLSLNLENRLAILDGYNNSDGLYDSSKYKLGNTYLLITSVNKKNIDILQAICNISGYRAKLSFRENILPRQNLYVLNILKREDIIIDFRGNSPIKIATDVWCVRGPGIIMVRHNGCVQLTHNSDIGYHWYLTRDGIWHPGRPETMRGSHAGKIGNDDSLGLCYEGTWKPTDDQITAIVQMYQLQRKAYGITADRWYGHYMFNSRKTCPGFSINLLQALFKATDSCLVQKNDN